MRWQYVRLFSSRGYQFSHDVGYDAEVSALNNLWANNLKSYNPDSQQQLVRTFDSLLDKMGADGWELVTVDTDYGSQAVSSGSTLYFKRAF
ncbi:MAG TPA: hypothetical protein VHZ03_29025 [Trebonia sp.]|jgi:hypothetical protein|nr:hypothetical protein [Trebonia sp.]